MAQATDPEETMLTIEDLGLEGVEQIPEPEPMRDLNVIQVKREDTRGLLAAIFLVGFFIILFAGMIIAALNQGDKVESVTAVLLAISGILSGPLGFVIGYYFRSQDK